MPGLKGVNWWAGVSVAKGTPQYVVDKWAKVTEEMGKDPVFLKKMDSLYFNVSYLGPADFKEYVYKEAESYAKLAPKLGVRK
ncbi:MAG: hypothetical protein A2162_05200 [Deltaproteobacteria bacterium RBG_13_52_11b]|nr:MAG: hypothetical protein A2162_05200 [Deltaproteobacteria bacterium RBG_13_52_11b]